MGIDGFKARNFKEYQIGPREDREAYLSELEENVDSICTHVRGEKETRCVGNYAVATRMLSEADLKETDTELRIFARTLLRRMTIYEPKRPYEPAGHKAA